MTWIVLEGMRFYAYHGVYEAEKIVGCEYVVDVFVRPFLDKKKIKDDDLKNTVNYETVFQICRLEMNEPRQLLETVGHGIVARLKHQFAQMESLRVRLRKLHPPLGGRLDSAYVEITLDFVSDCPNCKKKFINYGDGDCWERFPNLHPATRETLTRQFGENKCLCNECLTFYAG